jgi:hypothetical protein
MEGQGNLSDSDRNQAAPAGSVARDTKGKGLSGKARGRILNTMLFSSIARFATFQVTMLIILCVLGITYFITTSCSCCFQLSMCNVVWWTSLLCNGTDSCGVRVRNWMTRLRQSQQSSQEPATLGWSNHILVGP